MIVRADVALSNRGCSAGISAMQERLRSLLAESQRLVGVDDRARRERHRDEAWALMFEASRMLRSSHVEMGSRLRNAKKLRSLRAISGEHDGALARMLLVTAKTSLIIEMGTRDWPRSMIAANQISFAIASLNGSGIDEATRRDISAYLKRTPELAAYACRRGGIPQAAPRVLEAITSLALDDRMIVRSAQAYVHGPNARSGSKRVLGSIRRLLSDTSVAFVPQVPVTAEADTPISKLAQQLDALTKEDLANFAAASLDPGGLVSTFVLTTAGIQAFITAAATHRTLIYISAAYHGGAAFKIPQSGGPSVESIELPGLTFSVVEDLLARLRALSHDRNLQTRRSRAIHIDAILDDVGTAIWSPIMKAWPTIRCEPVAVVPVGETALLPLFTARVDGIVACTEMDLTITPSARSLFLANELKPTVRQDVLVAADPSLGSNPIPNTVTEAIAVAAVHGAHPLIIQPEHPVGSHLREGTRNHEFKQRLALASVVHLACHGRLSASDPLESSLIIGNGLRLEEILTGTLAAGSLMILSACEIGGISVAHPNEQMGFPGALLAAGTRSVVGALWGVPDHLDTVNFMIDYHKWLKTTPSNTALGHAIKAAQTVNVPSTVWAPFAHFGAISAPFL